MVIDNLESVGRFGGSRLQIQQFSGQHARRRHGGRLGSSSTSRRRTASA
jgi:hypothetical protein